MDDETLATLEHDNLLATMSQFGGSFPGTLVAPRGRRDDPVDRSPGSLFNQVLVSGPEASDDGIREAVDLIRARTGQFVVNLRVGADDRFLPAVAGLGLVPISQTPWMPGMAVWPIPPAARAGAGEASRSGGPPTAPGSRITSRLRPRGSACPPNGSTDCVVVGWRIALDGSMSDTRMASP